MIDKGIRDKGYACNPSNCECECDKSCDVGEYLDYENCKCRKSLVDKLVDKCSENTDEAKLTQVALFEHVNECVYSYTVCLVLGVIALTICTRSVINIKNFEPNLLKIDRKSNKNIGIYNTGHITIKKIDDCENIYSVNPLYLLINHASGYIAEKNENKYLIFDSADENKDLLKNTIFFGMELKPKSKQ